MRDHSKRFTLKEWREYIQRTKDLAAECDVNTDDLELPDEPLRWSKSDIRKVKDILVQTCPENLSESQGGEGPDDAPFNDKWFERFDKGRWSQGVIDSIDAAIERGCCGECCWHVIVGVNVNFTGNTVDNPQHATLITPAPCQATEAELAELFVAAMLERIATIPPGLENFSIEIVELVSLSSFPTTCEPSFDPPIIES